MPGGPRPPWAHSHLLPHLLEVVEQLQGCAEAFCDEAAALATPAHEPAAGQAVSPRGALRPPSPRATLEGPEPVPSLFVDCAPWDGDTAEFPALSPVLARGQGTFVISCKAVPLARGPIRGQNRERAQDSKPRILCWAPVPVHLALSGPSALASPQLPSLVHGPPLSSHSVMG